MMRTRTVYRHVDLYEHSITPGNGGGVLTLVFGIHCKVDPGSCGCIAIVRDREGHLIKGKSWVRKFLRPASTHRGKALHAPF